MECAGDKEGRAAYQWSQLLLIQLLTAAHVQPPPSTCLQIAAKVIAAVKTKAKATSAAWSEYVVE